MYLKLLLVTFVILNLTGCVATRKSVMNQSDQYLQTRVNQLEYETKEKDRKISDLEYELDAARAKSEKPKEIKVYSEKSTKAQEVKKKTESQQPAPKKIQLALKKAGFYKGSIDGEIGKGTKKAILDFQKSNGLKTDGIVGKTTWSKLCMYLD